MNRLFLILLIVLTASCTDNTKELYGTWNVVSKYYKGTNKIFNENDSIKAKVLYYNDGTTIITEKDSNEYYVFKNLKAIDGIYLDAVSGATKSVDVKPNIQLKPIHQDTLEVTTHLKNNPLKEYWVKVKE